MEMTNNFLNFKPTHLYCYVKNNYIDESKITTEELYMRILQDIELVLHILKVPTSRVGYDYWKDAILYRIVCEKDHLSVCHELYPVIAKKHNCSILSVERAMRLCFEETLYNSKNENNYIISFMKLSFINPHNSELLRKFADLIVSNEFRRFKNSIKIDVL